MAGVGVYLLFGLVYLALLWPTNQTATRLLQRWGVPEPTDAERAEALTYLRRRRIWYPWLFLGLPVAATATGLSSSKNNTSWSIVAMLLIGALLAEAFAQRRKDAPVRAAVPVRRGLTDIVPTWALAVHAVTAVGALALLGSALAGVGWARQWYSSWPPRTLWIAFAGAGLTILLVWMVVALALRRPPVAELRIDGLLRAPSARVPIGLGTAALCALIGSGGSTLGAVLFAAGVLFWSIIANPVRTPVPA